MDLSIIILNFNTKDLLRNSLQSVLASKTGYRLETLVSDNGSTDGSTEMIRSDFLGVKLIENGANLGFSKGNNIAIRKATGRYILLLNSDTEVRPDTFDLCIKKMDQDETIGILGCKILLPNGELDKAARRKFPNPWNSFLRLFGFRKLSDYNIDAPIDQEMEVDSVVGAYLMIRKSVMDKIGLLDEEFFMYGEDLDWCWRAKEAGFKVLYYPAATITHFKYGSSQQIPFFIIKMAHQAMKIFYRKHYAQKYNWLFNQLVYLGISTRMLGVLVVNIFRSKKSVH